MVDGKIEGRVEQDQDYWFLFRNGVAVSSGFNGNHNELFSLRYKDGLLHGI